MKNSHFLGRPPKYRELYASLDDDVLYIPAFIADVGIETGFILSEDPSVIAKERLRIRTATNLCFQKHLPENGDETIIYRGKSLRSWYGSTIKHHLCAPFDDDAKLTELIN